MMVHAEARETMAPSLPCMSQVSGCPDSHHFPESRCIAVAYLLAVQAARISLDADKLLAVDGESAGKGGIGVGEGRGQAVDVVLAHLQ
jgi:hypothetical protein